MSKMLKKNALIILVIITSFLVASCSIDTDKAFEQQGFQMGTVITEKVYGPNAEKAAKEAMEKMGEIERRMTINAPGSEIERLNEMSGKEAVALSPETVYVLKTAIKFSGLSQGAFDVTVGPLVKVWGVFTKNPRVPPQEEINNLLKMVGYKDLNINENENTAKLERPGQIVDLGGIAKGYAGDAAIDIYKKNGIKSAYINLGGNVVVLGTKPDGSKWNIGVQNPRAENGKYIGILKVANKAVVSSGDYERFFEVDNKRYHHIIDPRTGYPSESDLISTTIVVDKSIEADALSTATFVLGLDGSMKLLESIKGIEAVFITKDKKVYVTPGLKSSFTFDDESKEYEYVEKR